MSDQPHPELYLQPVTIRGAVVETYAEDVSVEIFDKHGNTVALLELPIDAVERAPIIPEP